MLGDSRWCLRTVAVRGVFYRLLTVVVAATDTVGGSLCGRRRWQLENTKIMHTLLLGFKCPQIEKKLGTCCNGGRSINYDFYLCFVPESLRSIH